MTVLRHTAKYKHPLILFAAIIFIGTHSARAQSVSAENVTSYCQNLVEEVQKSYPNIPESYAALGYVFYRSKKDEEAIAAFQKSLELNPKQPVIVQMMAFIYNRLTNYEKAAEWYRKTLEQDPRASRANERLGLALQQLNRMDEAMKAFEQEVKNYPEDASARVYLGERYLAKDRLEEAEEQAKLAMKYDPRLPEPYYLLGKIYRKQKKQEIAKEMLEIFQKKKDEEQELIEANVTELSDQERARINAAATHIEIGTIYFNRRQIEKAEFHYIRATGLDPKNIEARHSLALLYQQSNQLDKAEKVFQELLAINPEDPRFNLGLGLILFGQKKYTEARTSVEKVLDKNPDSISAKRTLAQILMSSNQDPQKALRLLESIQDSHMLAIDYDLLGRAYYINGKPQQCLEAIRKAITLEPNNQTYRKRYEKLLSVFKQ